MKADYAKRGYHYVKNYGLSKLYLKAKERLERDILERQYPSMKAWVEYMRRQETPDHLRQCGFQHGDWLALDREEGRGNRGSTDAYLIASAYYAHCT